MTPTETEALESAEPLWCACPWCDADVPYPGVDHVWDETTCPACGCVLRMDTFWEEGMDEEDVFPIVVEPGKPDLRSPPARLRPEPISAETMAEFDERIAKLRAEWEAEASRISPSDGLASPRIAVYLTDLEDLLRLARVGLATTEGRR